MSNKSKQKDSKKKSISHNKSKKNNADDCKLLKHVEEDHPRMDTTLETPELNEQFERFLDDMEIKGDKREALLKMDTVIKLRMLSTSKSIKISTPVSCVDLLKQMIHNPLSINDGLLTRNLESVWISLKSYKVSWLKEFYEAPNEGINVLIEVLKSLASKHDAALICLKCFRAFGNCGFGFFKLMHDKHALQSIAVWLRPELPFLMSVAVDILALLVFYNTSSHRNVLEALEAAAKFNKFENRFTALIKGAEIHSADEKGPLSLACVRFINVLVNPNFQEKGSELLKHYYRLHLRRELIQFGLLEVFKTLERLKDHPKILDLIKMFMEDLEIEESDNREEAECFITSFGNSDKIFSQLKSSICNTSAEASLQSILGTLLIVKDDPLRDKIFHFISKINSEIILQTDSENFCPDPTLRAFNEVSLKKIIRADVDEELINLKKQLAAQRGAYDDLKRQFITYKVDNPSKEEPKIVGRFKDPLHASKSTVLSMVKKKEST